MKIETGSASYTFSNIPREEFENLYEFLKLKDLPVPELKDIDVWLSSPSLFSLAINEFFIFYFTKMLERGDCLE